MSMNTQPTMSIQTIRLSKLAGCALLVYLAIWLSGCAHKPSARVVFTPTNPDVPSVIAPVNKAKESAKSARGSADRAVVIVEKLVPSPGQERMISELRLELATTVENLRLTSDQLDTALLRLPQLERQIAEMKDWGIAQQRLAATESDRATAERARANKEYEIRQRVTRQRDVFVYIIAALGTVALLLAGKDLLASISRGFGAYAPLASIIIWGAATAAVFLGIIAGTQLLLDLIV